MNYCFLATAIDEKQLDFTLYAHLGTGADVQLQLFFVTETEVAKGQLRLDTHLGKVAGQHRQLEVNFLGEEGLRHRPDRLTLILAFAA